MTYSNAFDDQWHGDAVYPGAADRHLAITGPDRFDLLRYRWEDQLQLTHPDVWAIIEAELGPVEAEWRQLVTDLDDAQADLHAARLRATEAADVNRQLGAAKAAREMAVIDRNLHAADAAHLAEAVDHLAEMLASTTDLASGTSDLLTDDQAAALKRHLPEVEREAPDEARAETANDQGDSE